MRLHRYREVSGFSTPNDVLYEGKIVYMQVRDLLKVLSK